MLAVHSKTMTDDRTDAELLRSYAAQGSRDALGELARRYVDLVYSAARRHTRDSHLAEDVTQAVFILLASRARRIRQSSHLVGWLYQTTYFTAANALKRERRRHHHEHMCATAAAIAAVAAQEHAMSDGHSQQDDWNDVGPVLDWAMAQLDRSTRDLLLMRYFQAKTVPQVAGEMGLSVDATQKRLSRAVEKLRGLLSRRGVRASAVGVSALLLSKTVEAAPLELHATVQAVAASTAAPSAASTQLAGIVHRWITNRARRAIAAAVVIAVAGGSLVINLASPASPVAPTQSSQPLQLATASPAADPDRAAISAWSDALANGPIPKPWPIALPGCISGAPFPVDLFGDGKTETVVPCMELDPRHQARIGPTFHPHPTLAALVYAFYLDGTTVPGFPVQLASVETREIGIKKFPQFSDAWYSSPSAVKIDGKDVIVIASPPLKEFWDRALDVIHSDGSLQIVRVAQYWKPDPNVPICALQLQKDGPLELLGGYAELDGNEIKPSRLQRPMVSGFDVAVGDANGDGQTRIYQSVPKPDKFKSWNGVVYGYDSSGHVLPGWPQPTGGQGISTAMGDLFGDGKMEIIVPDNLDRLLAWTADGQPFGRAHADDPEKAKTGQARMGHPMPHGVPSNELSTSILREDLPFAGPLSLADIDGDGRPEMVFYCRDHTLRALHGDGTGFGNADGIIARFSDAFHAQGVSIANLGGDGEMDFFLGTCWVHRAADGSVTQTEMLPGAMSSHCQPTIVDLDGDGLADILVGTNDGRVFIYHTGKPYRRERIHWATIDGDLNHTACWHNPDPAAKPVVPGL
jgi:RNA polymerase sigma factor (sigma-70 family)